MCSTFMIALGNCEADIRLARFDQPCSEYLVFLAEVNSKSGACVRFPCYGQWHRMSVAGLRYPVAQSYLNARSTLKYSSCFPQICNGPLSLNTHHLVSESRWLQTSTPSPPPILTNGTTRNQVAQATTSPT